MRSTFRHLVTLIIVALACTPASAQEKAEDFIEPRVDRTQFQQFLAQLNLGKDMRNIATLLYADYTAAMTDLAARLDEQALAAGRKTVQDGLAGKARIEPEELKRMRLAVLNVYVQAGAAADAALADLLEGVKSLLAPEQEGDFEVAARALRRAILLHPRQEESEFQEYAGDGVDVLLLAQEAMEEGGELAAVDAAAVAAVLSAYELQLDALIAQNAAAHRQGKLARKMAGIERNAEAAKQQEQAAIARWRQLYELNDATVRQVAAIAASTSGEAAAQQWIERFDQACFTWLYPRRKPDRQIEWMREQGLAAEVIVKAESTYAQYVQKRNALSRRAIDMMLRARLEFQSMLYSMMDRSIIDERLKRGLYEDLLKNTGEQANLESTTSAALEALLNDGQREKMREAMKRPDPARRRDRRGS